MLRLALEDSVRRHAAWQAEHPELVEAATRRRLGRRRWVAIRASRAAIAG